MVVDQVCVVRRDMSECLNQDILFLGTCKQISTAPTCTSCRAFADRCTHAHTHFLADGRILKVVFATDRASRSNVNPVITEEITVSYYMYVIYVHTHSDGQTRMSNIPFLQLYNVHVVYGYVLQSICLN